MFIWLEAISAKKKNLTKQDFLSYFADDVSYSINGKIVANNAHELQNRFIKLIQTNQLQWLIKPSENIIVSGNTIGVSYQLKFPKHKDQIIALITMKNGKITQWQAATGRTG